MLLFELAKKPPVISAHTQETEGGFLYKKNPQRDYMHWGLSELSSHNQCVVKRYDSHPHNSTYVCPCLLLNTSALYRYLDN